MSDDGTVQIAHSDAEGAEAARSRVEALCAEIKVGAIYEGKVISIKEFGAFIEIAPGRDGLCHISELDTGYVGRVEDVVKIGDRVTVKVIAIDDQDRVKLSRKALLPRPEGAGNGEIPGGAAKTESIFMVQVARSLVIVAEAISFASLYFAARFCSSMKR